MIVDRRAEEDVAGPILKLLLSRVGKLASRLRAELSFTPLDEILSGLRPFFANIQRQCAQIHTATYQVYITYPIEAALEA